MTARGCRTHPGRLFRPEPGRISHPAAKSKIRNIAMKILIVDDSRSTLQLITHTVDLMGQPYVTAASGSEALAAFQASKPDLILLDVVLPDVDGFEVARRIREIEGNADWTPIIFLTSLDKDEDLERGIAVGGDDYLHKPVNQVVLSSKIRAMQRILEMRLSLEAANRELHRLTHIDGLTGVANRRSFDQMLDTEWRRMGREKKELSLLLCDVDHFKKYNDHYGHLGGDDCLRQVAQTIQKSVSRGGDNVSRYGGEEFAVILPATSQGGALMVAERVRHEIKQLSLPHTQSELGQVTLSIGLATVVPSNDSAPEQLIAIADKALYGAKQGGRNRVVHP